MLNGAALWLRFSQSFSTQNSAFSIYGIPVTIFLVTPVNVIG
jgi:hypothetical protein